MTSEGLPVDLPATFRALWTDDAQSGQGWCRISPFPSRWPSARKGAPARTVSVGHNIAVGLVYGCW